MKIIKVMVIVETDERTFTTEVDLNEFFMCNLSLALHDGKDPSERLIMLADKGVRVDEIVYDLDTLKKGTETP